MRICIVDRSLTAVSGDVASAIKTSFPEVDIHQVPNGAAFDQSVFSVDSILLIFFDAKTLSRSDSALVTAYKDEWGEHARIVAIACGSAQYLDELSNLKSLSSSEKNFLENATRRIGAFLGLMTIPKDHQIFISYRATDGKVVAERLSAHFKKIGYEVWWDEDRDEDNEGNLKVGEDVQAAIRGAIRASSLVLLVDTPDAPGSRWVREEIDYCNEQLIPLIPICIRDTGGKHGSHFYNLRSLIRYVQADSSLANLDTIEKLIQGFLQDVYLRRRRIPALVKKRFTARYFDWNQNSNRELLFDATKKTKFSALRILSQLPLYEGVHESLITGYTTTVGSIGQKYQNKLYVYDGTRLSRTEVDRLSFSPSLSQMNITLLHHEEIEEFLCNK